MLGQVIIGSVSNTPQFAPAEREQELDIGSTLTVEAKLFRAVVTQTDLLMEPFKVSTGCAEELQLHLLELSGTESKVTGSDLVTERFTDLPDTERNFLT